jgi:hypothetical protein
MAALYVERKIAIERVQETQCFDNYFLAKEKKYELPMD